MQKKWYEKTYRRTLFDMHIDDWDARFLSKFDPQAFVDAVLATGAQTVTVPANNHAGICFFPTKVGEEHQTVRGKNTLGVLIDLLHKHNLNVIVYYCTIYCDWYWDTHLDARIVDADGKSEKLLMNSSGLPRRFSVSCMNNPGYRDFVVAELKEICALYDFEGSWPDMTFWPTVCYCPSCQARLAKEVGGEIPRIIDWTDPRWVQFQHKRQEWVVDFCQLITSTLKRLKPNATVAHQAQTYCGDWLFGASTELTRHTDWLSSDLYADRHQLSFFAKLFYSLSENKPFEHLNSWTYPNIHEHVVPRTEDHLKIMAYSAIMNHGAVAYIDAVDPIGTVNRDNYERAGRVFAEVEPLESYVGGIPQQDVAIYYSFESLFDLADNGKPVSSTRYNFETGRVFQTPDSHRNAAVCAARSLLQDHIPYAVITKKSLADLSNYQVIVLANVVALDDSEVVALRTFVQNGGSLYASKHTSMINGHGVWQPDFLLADVFGASYQGITNEGLTYVAPSEALADMFGVFSRAVPATLQDRQLQVEAHHGTETMATVTLPFTDPKGTPFASILSDPPDKATNLPALLMNTYGKGRVIYAAGKIEIWETDTQRSIFTGLIRRLASRPFAFEVVGPKSVEVTLFDQPEAKRLIAHLLNFQLELPNIPVDGLILRVWMGQRTVRRVAALPVNADLPSTVKDGWVEIMAPKLQNYQMIAIEYSQPEQP